MANRNAFLAVKLDHATLEALDQAAHALQASTAELLGMSPGVGFDPVDRQSLHMTFLFFGKYLRELPAAELLDLHAAIRTAVATVDMQALTTPMAFVGFELFPPQKMNLVVARFEAPSGLLQLRQAVLQACRKHGLSLPSSFYSLIAGEGAWTPHVTLGKIRASQDELGRASCGDALHACRLQSRAQPRGLILLGDPPPRAWCDWDQALSFGADENLSQSEGEDDGVIEENGDVGHTTSQSASAKLDAEACVAAWLESPQLLSEVSQSKFQQFDSNRNGLLEFPECSELCRDLTDFLCISMPEGSRLRHAFGACCRSHQEAMTLKEFTRFFTGFLRSCSNHNKTMTLNAG